MKIKLLFLFIVGYFLSVSPVSAQLSTLGTPHASNMKAQVVSVSENMGPNQSGVRTKLQKVEAKIVDGPSKGQIVSVSYDPLGLTEANYKVGQTVVLSKQKDAAGRDIYAIYDVYRLPTLAISAILFLLLILLVAGKKGIGSILGLSISLGIIFFYIVPQVLKGGDPLPIIIAGSAAILLVTTYVAHGFSRQTTIALISTLIALILTWIISTLAIDFTSLSGVGTEDAFALHLGIPTLINFRGLLLGGIILATLGALNDVTTTQTASIFELHKTNPRLNFDQLLKKGMMMGREHVVSLVNTLVLAFIGTSFLTFLVYFFNPMHTPLWVIINSEIISEEIIRTIAGTSGLILAMPIVTILATFVCVDLIGEKHK